MEHFYGQQATGQHVQQRKSQSSTDMDGMIGLDLGSLNDPNTDDAQSLSNMFKQDEWQAGRQLSQGHGQESGTQVQGMMEFTGSGQAGELDQYQFNPSHSDQAAMMTDAAMFGTGVGTGISNQQMVQPMSASQFIGQSPQFIYESQQGNISTHGQFMPQNQPMAFNYNDPQMMAALMNAFSMMPQAQFPGPMTSSTQTGFLNSDNGMQRDAARTGNFEGIEGLYSQTKQDQKEGARNHQRLSQSHIPHSSAAQGSFAPVMKNEPNHGDEHQSNSWQQALSSFQMQNKSDQPLGESRNSNQRANSNTHSQAQTSAQNDSHDSDPADMATWGNAAQGLSTSTIRKSTVPTHQFKNAYSSTGFDMLAVLMRVATRKNPEINIGAVDLSCAFVVCDVSEHDIPIVYCSENFERLTGYTKHEILGRNCRFLQSPDGRVKAGVQRGYVDDDSVLYMKNMVTARREAQVSIINYRKGGQPFMNLLTVIPVPYDTDEIRFFVGFQVDLVEQPNAVTNKNPDGSYTINYQRGLTMPRYVVQTPDFQNSLFESGQTVSRDDVSTVLSTIGIGESELSKRIWDKVLLENADDLIFVLSLKGLFLYLSPSSKKVLEYDAHELVGTALSSVCHPSDIVPVTRELKDTSSSSNVNIVFRVRRKTSGYMWFEGHGSLHAEQGKGRKSIVLVGRERPVFALSRADVFLSGGISENEVWTKLSTSGMFLFVSSNIRSLLDKTPDELVGTSIQALMRPESKADFMRVLEVARSGKKASAKHELLNRRGQVLQAFSNIYPGDAIEGQKPTFVIAQSRLLKYSRPEMNAASMPQPRLKLERESSAGSVATSTLSVSLRREHDVSSLSRFMAAFEAATTHAGQDGLVIGHQDNALAAEGNLFVEFKTTRSTSWQFELRQMEKRNRLLAEELQGLLAARKKRKRRKGVSQVEKDCANCHTRTTPEWRRGPSGNRDLCNSCGLRWAKQQGRISPRASSQRSVHSASSEKGGTSPQQQHGKADASFAAEQEAAQQALAAATFTNIHKTVNQPCGDSENTYVSKLVRMEANSPLYNNNLPTHMEEEDDDV